MVFLLNPHYVILRYVILLKEIVSVLTSTPTIIPGLQISYIGLSPYPVPYPRNWRQKSVCLKAAPYLDSQGQLTYIAPEKPHVIHGKNCQVCTNNYIAQ